MKEVKITVLLPKELNEAYYQYQLDCIREQKEPMSKAKWVESILKNIKS